MTVFLVILSSSYAYFEESVEGSCVTLEVGELIHSFKGEITLEKGEKEELKVIVESNNNVASKYQLYYKSNDDLTNVFVGYSTSSTDLPYGDIEVNTEKHIKLVLQNNSPSKVTIEIGVRGGLASNTVEDIILNNGEYRINQEFNDSVYTDLVLNGTDPVLTDNLVPVLIADDGTVTKADIAEEWYNYTNQEWANAVVLIDNTVNYAVGDTIPEDNIESYFVWIPRYKYKIFDLGDYSSMTSVDAAAVQTIEVEFETKEMAISTGSAVGDWHSHPAFQAFDSNGFWVGKFEPSGGSGNTYSPESIRIKPGISSWRSITVGIAFQNSYNYLREDESHMMKNTEWGAVAYLQHSTYGSRQSLRVNNNSSYLTGYASVSEPTCGYNNATSTSCNLVGTATSVTLPYNTTTGYLASTTGNISGVYDMSGGAWECVMGYTTAGGANGGSSGLTSIFGDFFTNETYEKYYDKYTETSQTVFTNRILGDATGEMGPFSSIVNTSSQNSSWYGDYGTFVTAARPWFARGGTWSDGVGSGAFAFSNSTGGVYTSYSFRVVLTP